MIAKIKPQKQKALKLRRFAYKGKRRLDRVGVVDVGSNSVRLVIFDGAARSPAYFFNEKVLCGLGEDMSESGVLNPRGRARALAALKRFVLLAEGMEIGPLSGVATAAVREARDGPAFCEDVKRETGLTLTVASGQEEARLSAQGVLLGWPGAKGLMCDIGGSSMELAEIGGGDVGHCQTSALGPLKLASITGGQKAIDTYITDAVAELRRNISGEYDHLFLVGGSWRAIARLDMERRNYPLKVLHEYEMTPDDIGKTTDWIATMDLDALRAITGSSKERMRLVPMAARVLTALMRQFQPAKIAASSYGIREGLLYERMPKKLRRRDPLIEACLHMERASARNPGFGRTMYDFLSPLFVSEPTERKRLIKAACLLHDVTWRAHPDYRAEVCFDNATRANLGGLDHKGRVFLGTALLHRYKNSRVGTNIEGIVGLLSEDEVNSAEILGRAMRFGAMLSGPSAKMMGVLKPNAEDRMLELILSDQARDLYGEVVLMRFESLAKAMGYAPKLSVA